MKTLFECNIDDKVRVKKINAPKELKQRLISFGVIKGAIIEILTQAPAKKTIEIKVSKMRIGLRGEEAKMIEVEKI